VPTQYIDVVVKAGATNYPIVSTNGICRALSTLSGATVTVKNGFTLQIVGK
jgi:hypothetical protein